MSWDAVSAIAEIVGGVAVIVTLIYLSIQVRQSNRQEATTAVKEAFETFMAAFASVTETELQTDNFRSGINRFNEMTSNEQAMFQAKMQYLGNGYYQVWTLHKSGMLMDEELFEGCRNAFLTIIKTAGGRQWWAQWKRMPPQPFIQELDALIDDPNSAVPPIYEIWSWLKESPVDEPTPR